MKKITLTSDIHLDFWLGINDNPKKLEKKVRKLVEKLLPDEESDTLIVAGDVGHHNHQNEVLFKVLRDYYKDVCWVHGNHDLYMVSNKIKKKFDHNSFNRLTDMIERSGKIDGVHYLNGTSVTIDGVTIGGTAMWYDYEYARKVWGYSYERTQLMWTFTLNDANLIRVPNENGDAGIMNNRGYFQEQLKLMEGIYKKCDVIVCHVPPDWSNLNSKWRMPETTFYNWNGEKLLNDLDDKKIWHFGHTHDKYFYTHSSGCTMVCNPVDYAPSGNWEDMDLSRRKFITLEANKALISYDDVFKDLT